MGSRRNVNHAHGLFRLNPAVLPSVFVLFTFAILYYATPPVHCFTQGSPITERGHEVIIEVAARDILGLPFSYSVVVPFNETALAKKAAGANAKVNITAGPQRGLWTVHVERPAREIPAYQLLTPKLTEELLSFRGNMSGIDSPTGSYAVESAVMGNRWVDLGGFSATSSLDCFAAMPQDNTGVQTAHFLRKVSNVGGQGALDVVKLGRDVFAGTFAQAAMADEPKEITFLDGGAKQDKLTAQRNFFMFGRPLHLLQDSFSTEHAFRDINSNLGKVLGIKSYGCTQDSAQHQHSIPTGPSHGDYIYVRSPRRHDPHPPRKPEVEAAIFATRDAFISFLKTLAVPRSERLAFAQKEAQILVDRYFNYDEKELLENAPVKIGGNTFSQSFSKDQAAACEKAIGDHAPAKADPIMTRCRRAMHDAGDKKNGRDPYMHNIPFFWEWN